MKYNEDGTVTIKKEEVGLVILGVMNNYAATTNYKEPVNKIVKWLLEDDYYKDIFLESEIDYGKLVVNKKSVDL